jgi:hypothetical protein
MLTRRRNFDVFLRPHERWPRGFTSATPQCSKSRVSRVATSRVMAARNCGDPRIANSDRPANGPAEEVMPAYVGAACESKPSIRSVKYSRSMRASSVRSRSRPPAVGKQPGALQKFGLSDNRSKQIARILRSLVKN